MNIVTKGIWLCAFIIMVSGFFYFQNLEAKYPIPEIKEYHDPTSGHESTTGKEESDSLSSHSH